MFAPGPSLFQPWALCSKHALDRVCLCPSHLLMVGGSLQNSGVTQVAPGGLPAESSPLQRWFFVKAPLPWAEKIVSLIHKLSSILLTEP